MKVFTNEKFRRVIKILGISVILILFLMLVFPFLFSEKISTEVKAYANENLEGKLDFHEANLSFFHHFPSLTLQLKDFSVNGSAPYKNETLLKANEISFGINLSSLIFKKQIAIDEIFISDALINIKVNKNGEANYNIYKKNNTTVDENSESTSVHLDKIAISNCHLLYNDLSVKMQIDAKGFNYLGKGNLDQAIFDLHTEASINSLDFTFDQQNYLKNKKVKATLITQINTNSLSFLFQENNLKINKLPVNFIGKLDFLKDGYNLNFEINSINSKLNDFFTALPPQYVTWLEKTTVKGDTDLSLTLKGKYIESTNTKPDLAFNMKIREGYINNNKAPIPVDNLYLNFDTKLPSLDIEKLQVNIDSVFFNVDKDYLKAIVKTIGFTNPKLDANIKASLDLQKMNKAFGISNIEAKGLFTMDLIAKGVYNKSKKIYPITRGQMALKKGSILTAYYPNAINNINFLAKISNQNGAAKDMKIEIDHASFLFEDKPFEMKASFQNLEDIAYNIKAKGQIDVAKVYKVFSKKGMNLDGIIKADIDFQGRQSDAVNGNYNKLNNKGTLELQNIKLNSEYLPLPFVIKNGLFTFNQDKMYFKNFTATYGKSDFEMNGYLQNTINFVLTENEILKGNFNFNSNYINIDEFMSEFTETATVTNNDNSKNESNSENGVIIIPKNLDLKIVANANKINFEDLEITDLKGNLSIENGQLNLNNSSFDIIGCHVTSNLAYANETNSVSRFDFAIVAKDFDIKSAYNEVKMFHDMASSAENAEGIVSLNYTLKGKLNQNMQPIYPSLIGNGTLSVKNVKMKGYKMFAAVSKKTENEEIKNPDISKVDINTTIKNNIITIEKFKFKFAGFRPKIEGTTSFDGKLNIKMRLGLPPLGIIGIPMTITGTQDNPIVKLGKKTQEIEETEYDEKQQVNQ